MATRVSVPCEINGYWTYKQGWSWTDGSGSSWKYFGQSSVNNEDFGPICVSFYVPSSKVSGLLTKNPSFKLSFDAYNIISDYGNNSTLKYYVTTQPRKADSKSIQGSEDSHRKSAINTKSVTISTSKTTITTAEIRLNGVQEGITYYCWFYIGDDDVRKYCAKNISATVYYDAYSNCSAPTSISFKYNGETKASPYTHPSDNGTSNITLQWSGAKAGTGMSIKGYSVQRYNEGSKKWEEEQFKQISATSSSCTLAEGERGTVRTYRIVTKGTVEGYDSGASNLVYIYFNSKPTAPGGSDLTVKSTAETAKIPITIPVTNYSYKTNTRTMKLWWKSSTNSEWRNSGESSQTDGTRIYNFPVDPTPIPGESKIYYFKMVDIFGDESDILKITLKRSVSLSVPSFIAILKNQSKGEMNVSFSTNTSAHKDSIKIELMSGTKTIASVKVPWKDSINLLTEGPAYNGSMALTYKFTLNVSDDFGDSASKKAATYLNSGDTIERDIKISALPNDVTLYNTLTGDSLLITGVNDLRFFQNVRAEFQTYALMTSNAVLYIGDSSIQYTPVVEAGAFKFGLNKNEILNKLTVSALKGRIDFSFSLGTKITNSFSKTIYFSPRPNINIVPPFSTFKMYDQGTGTFQINGVFDGFGLKTVNIKGINEVPYEITDLEKPDTAGYKISGFKMGDLFPLTKFGDKERQGTISKVITLTATNVLGVTQTTQTTITLDFRKTPDNIKIGTITYGDSSDSLPSAGACEGTKIHVPFTYTLYGADTIRFSISYDGVEKTSISLTPDAGASIESGTKNQSRTFDFIIPAVPFGKTSASITVKANLVGSTDEKTGSIALALSPYENPGMNVLSSELSEQTLTLNYSLRANGNGDYSYSLQFEGENESWVDKISDKKSPSPFTFSSDDTLSGNQLARVKIIYTYPTNTTRAGDNVESYSNVFTIFAEGPTVSYRKNHIGINNPSPADGTIVDIATTSGRNKIKFSNDPTISIELVASDVDDGPQLIFTKGNTTYTFTFDSQI